MFSPKLLLSSLLGLASSAQQIFSPRSIYRGGTHSKRTRVKSEPGMPGAKLNKAILRNRVGLKGSVTGATLWAINRGKRAMPRGA